jgi:streptogramin lyase
MKTHLFSGNIPFPSTPSLNPSSSFPPKKSNRFFSALAAFAPLLVLGTLAHAQATNFGSQAIGTTSSATTVTVTFTASVTLNNISVLTQGATGLDFADAGGGTCAVGTGYNSADTCTVNVTFNPKFAGTRYGAVVLQDASSNVVGNTYLQGSGLGPQTTFLPGTETSVDSGRYSYPEGVATDGNGNLYIADTFGNRVLKETFSAGTYTESVVPTSTLFTPEWVSVDGAGNLYITDTGNNRVLKETLSASGFTETVLPTSSLSAPFSGPVDGNGNVYIADYSNNRVLKETLSGGTYTESTVTISDLNGPEAVAVDSVGNLYVVDDSNRLIKETFSAGSYTESTIATSSLADPYGVTVDGNGNIYVTDSGNNRILKETPASGGTFTESTIPSSSLYIPIETAVDGAGNVYIADLVNNRVLKEDLADPPTVSFAATADGSTSTDSPKTVTVNNSGNSSLTFTAVNFPTDFPENSPAPGDCTSSTVLSATATCTLTINFSPTALINGGNPNLLTEGVAVTTNTLNVSATQQTVVTTGTETP